MNLVEQPMHTPIVLELQLKFETFYFYLSFLFVVENGLVGFSVFWRGDVPSCSTVGGCLVWP